MLKKNILTLLLAGASSMIFYAQNPEGYLGRTKIPDKSEEYDLKNLSVNSAYSDYGVAYYTKEKAVFSSTRKHSSNNSKRWKGNDEFYINFYMGTIKEDGDIEEFESVKGMANSKYHESSATFNKDRTKVYFTRNTVYQNKKFLSSDRILKLSIFVADVAADGSWSNIVPFPYNSDEYSNSHPTLSLDGKKLYFASDMPGTLGNTDIFFVEIKGDGTFSEPKNLGSNINTPGKDSFPFIASDGTLYFSSDGHKGIGNLDIFKTDSDEYEIAAVQNIGLPFNSSRDDFAFSISDNMLEGYFSSNRPGGKGNDDIYYFASHKLRPVEEEVEEEVVEEVDCHNLVKGNVTDDVSDLPLEGVLVTVENREGEVVYTSTTAKDGMFSFDAECKENYTIKTSKSLYLDEQITAQTSSKDTDEFQYNINMVQEVKRRNGKIFIDIESIYFEFNEDAITQQAALQLEKVIAFMRKYPKTIIEGSSHTDCRGSAKYNLELSSKRAKSTVDFIVKYGQIDPSRISAKGYGEDAPLNHCIDGVGCTEEEYAVNRRTEFEIVNQDELE